MDAERFLRADVGRGDITTELTVPDTDGTARIVCEGDCTVAGISIVEDLFESAGVSVTPLVRDGDRVAAGTRVLSLSGPMRSMITIERTALNILMRMSGVATATSAAVAKADGRIVVAATRKTTPGFGDFEKEAVRIAGGDPHRKGLDSMIMVKDNHIKACGGVRACMERLSKRSFAVKVEVEVENGHEKIIITEIPYLVNKAELIKNIADLVNEKKIDGISNVNDESDRQGMRIVVDVKRDANSSVVLNKLYKLTALQSSFSVNNIALVNGRPRLLNLKDLIHAFVAHRHEVVLRRTRFDLRKAEERAHILEGLIIASDNIDEVIAIIRSSKNPQDAMERLMARFSLSEAQSRAIVEMRLRQLTGLEQDKLRAEYEEIEKLIAYLKEILENDDLCRKVIKDELLEIKEKYGDERKTDIVYASKELNPEDFYADDEMIITISHMGYIKRTPLKEFRAQGRGGVGAKGSETRDEDFVEYIYPASMHATLLFFTAKGKCYWLKVYEIPEGAKNAKGRAIQNLLSIEADDKIQAFVRVKKLTTDTEFINSHYLLFCTRKGVIKKTLLEAYSRPRQNGVNAITLHEDDGLIQVCMTNGDNEVLIANRNGRAIRFHESAVREMGRNAAGVRGMTLDDDGEDEVVGMVCVKDKEKETILVVSEQGYGKRSSVEDYRKTNRGAKGVKTLNITEKTGKLVAIMNVTDENDLMIINKSGIAIRLNVADLSVIGRATQGVRLINLGKRNDEIASVCKVLSNKEEEIAQEKAEREAIQNAEEGNPEERADYGVTREEPENDPDDLDKSTDDTITE